MVLIYNVPIIPMIHMKNVWILKFHGWWKYCKDVLCAIFAHKRMCWVCQMVCLNGSYIQGSQMMSFLRRIYTVGWTWIVGLYSIFCYVQLWHTTHSYSTHQTWNFWIDQISLGKYQVIETEMCRSICRESLIVQS